MEFTGFDLTIQKVSSLLYDRSGTAKGNNLITMYHFGQNVIALSIEMEILYVYRTMLTLL